ncbi:hypothetical protein HAP47_0039920 [Bradyrhizobium sp. 41S5]|uniref:hypothetical protein n=1 Tax=Bradyrhizobium sp. 41S5 TaxID=1404443 RepID=UPI00156B4992|nr:hypothetical protein [Bradyrhizobium sp. 41S5]UFX45053.1 hypothetical protein HAP47_0039920 [Bradyrhizobium sp. 41S5]
MVGFPLLLVPLAVYNIIAFLMPGVSFTDPLIRLTLLSGEQWQITLSDMLLAAGVLLLLLEVIKGARPGAKYLTDHLLSLIVFGAAAAEFVLWPKFGNSTYCLLTLLALVDFISGIALRTRRRAVVAPAAPVPVSKPQPAAVETPRPAPAVGPAPPAPVVTPAPAAPVPPATSVAESVLLDQSAPKPTVNSPDLQPGGQPPSDTPQR